MTHFWEQFKSPCMGLLLIFPVERKLDEENHYGNGMPKQITLLQVKFFHLIYTIFIKNIIQAVLMCIFHVFVMIAPHKISMHFLKGSANCMKF